MKLKRIASIYLSLCLVVVYILSAPIQVQAADDEVAERPVWDDSYSVDETPEFDPSVFEAAANKIEDLDESDLVPVSKNRAQFIAEHKDDVVEAAEVFTDSDADPGDHDDEIEPQMGLEIAAGVGAIILIMLSAFSSGLKLNGVSQSLYNSIDSDISSDASDASFSYFFNDFKHSIMINKAARLALKNALDNSRSANGYSVNLSNENKATLAYYLKKNSLITDINLSNINIKPVGENKYYYIGSGGVGEYGIHVLYTTDPVAFAEFITSRWFFYRYNPLLTSDVKYETMPYTYAYYYLSSVTGKYELVTDETRFYKEAGNCKYDARCFPFNTYRFTNMGQLKSVSSYYISASPLMLNDVYNEGKVICIDDLMKLIANLLFQVLPESPFQKFYKSLGQIPGLGYLNYFVPVSEMIVILESWLAAIAIFYIYQIALRWIKMIE